jgi:mono/diheme cytochrome c family protein
MPAFKGALTDEDLAEIVDHVRTLGGGPAWKDVLAEVKATRKEGMPE